MSLKIGLVTCSEYSSLPKDEQILVNAFTALGHRVSAPVWNDKSVQWDAFDACVVRSTWDFHLDPASFSDWIGLVDRKTLLINSARLMRWNLHKRYLLELSAAGIQIVPTALLARGSVSEPAARARLESWPKYVLKPAVSASSYRTKVFDLADNSAIGHLSEIHRDSDALMQPFVPDVEVGGEKSYVAIDGAFTHVIKRASFNGGARGIPQPKVEEVMDEQNLARVVLSYLPDAATYARIDLVRLESGEPAVAEVETVEPSLFFSQHPASAQLLAESVVRRILAQ